MVHDANTQACYKKNIYGSWAAHNTVQVNIGYKWQMIGKIGNISWTCLQAYTYEYKSTAEVQQWYYIYVQYINMGVNPSNHSTT